MSGSAAEFTVHIMCSRNIRFRSKCTHKHTTTKRTLVNIKANKKRMHRKFKKIPRQLKQSQLKSNSRRRKHADAIDKCAQKRQKAHTHACICQQLKNFTKQQQQQRINTNADESFDNFTRCMLGWLIFSTLSKLIINFLN